VIAEVRELKLQLSQFIATQQRSSNKVAVRQFEADIRKTFNERFKEYQSYLEKNVTVLVDAISKA
jgi:hypothetical protein